MAIDNGAGEAPKPGNACLIPTSDMMLAESWNTVALRATGSDTAVADGLFVPAHHMILADRPLGSDDNRQRGNGAPSDRWPIGPFVGRTGVGQAVGIAEAMLSCVTADAVARPITATCFARKADSQVVQKDIGEYAAKIRAARLMAEQAADELDQAALSRRAMTTGERAACKAMSALAMKLIDDASQGLMMIAGSSALSHANPLSRYWRDLAMVSRHVQNIPNLGFETYGRALLAIEPNIFPPPLI